MTVSQAYKASSDCCRPVPEINTSQWVSLRDSMASFALGECERSVLFSCALNRLWLKRQAAPKG